MPERPGHKHEFTSLYSHFGAYREQDEHYHPCTRTEDCDRVLIGQGRECGGSKDGTHRRVWLGED